MQASGLPLANRHYLLDAGKPILMIRRAARRPASSELYCEPRVKICLRNRCYRLEWVSLRNPLSPKPIP